MSNHYATSSTAFALQRKLMESYITEYQLLEEQNADLKLKGLKNR